MQKIEKEIIQKYLVLLKIDAENLFERINGRHKEFMDDFSLKRDRSIFKEIFFNRYESMQISELVHFSVEIIELANQYYQLVDDLHWYLIQTQDMPTTIEDEVIHYCSRLKVKLENLMLYIEAELGGEKVPERIEQEAISESFIDAANNSNEDDSSTDWGEESDF